MNRTLFIVLVGIAALIFAYLLGAGGAALAVFALAFAVLAAGARNGDEPRRKPRPTVADDPKAALLSDNPGFHAMIEGLEDQVLLVKSGRVVDANRAAKLSLGDYIVGMDVRSAIRHPAAAERLLRTARGIADAPINIYGLGRMDRRLEMRTIPLPDGSIYVVLADRSSIDTAQRARSDFVANASHELRTPLAAIQGFIETLEDPATIADEAARTRFLGIMKNEAARMALLVDDLLSLSRVEANRFRAPTGAVDLGALAQSVLGDLDNGGSPRIADIALDIGGDCTVIGDRSELSQLLHNLVGNAIKYSKPGDPIAISARCEGAMCALIVSDSGEGIAAEHLPRLTERFYRADTARSRAAGGTGLGLSLVKHIVEHHRGRLTIDSEPARGTTVTVTLPAFAQP